MFAPHHHFLKQPLDRCTLVDLVRHRAMHQPGQTAYRFLGDGETESASLTYQELDRRSRAIAAQLQAFNLWGERALLLYPPGLDYISAFFGCSYAGVIAVPAYPPHNQRNTPRIQAVVADANATIALTTSTIQDRTQSLLADKTELDNIQWLATDTLDDRLAKDWQTPAIVADSLAFLQYTSGSTGTPKGVMLSHGNLLHNAAITYHCMEHSDTSQFVSWLPVYHDMGLIGGVLQPLYGGFPCTLMSPASFLQRPYRWLQAISRYGGTTSGGPNFAYELCVDKITPEQRKTLDLSSWSVAFNGAEPIRQSTLERFAATFAECGFRPEAFYPCYGLAEASLMVTGSSKADRPISKPVDAAALEQNYIQNLAVDAVAESQVASYVLVGSGQAVPEQQIVIAHPESGARCADNEIGEIWVSGPSVGQGYWNRPDKTFSTFQAYLSDTHEGPFLRTGDLGFLHQGELFVTGRAKDLIIIRGRNLYPQDLELTAEQSHPALRAGSSAAFAVEVDAEERLVVVQEVEFRQKPDVADVTAAIRQAIAEAYEVQAYGVVLIKPGTIPKTSSGKIQRRACRSEFLAGKLQVLGSSILEATEVERDDRRLSREALLATSLEARQTQLETYLQHQVTRILKAASSPDPHQPLAAWGLDSLKIVELKNQVETDLEIEIGFTCFFSGASIAQFAQQILAQLETASPVLPLESISRDRNLPLSFAQERLWFLDQLEPGNPFYNLAATIRLVGHLDIAALHQSLNALIERHEILRTRFVSVDGQPTQIVSTMRVDLPILDLSNVSPTAQESEVRRLSLEQAQSSFDLQQGSLLRAQLVSLREHEHVLLLCAHHIIFDGWSTNIFLQELASFYQTFLAQKSSLLPALPIQYADFATWQRQWLQGEILDAQLTYWKRQLAGSLPVLNLPTDFPRLPMQTFHGARRSFVLSQLLHQALLKLSQQEGTTLFMTLLAAFKTLLHRYTGQEDILVGTPIANRNRAELEDLIGFFVNTLVLRTDLTSNPSFRELLSRVRHVALEAYAHQDLPFEKLVEELQPERDLSYSPLFQVSFVLQTALTQTLSLPDLTLSLNEVDTEVAKFDLTLFVEETAEGLIGTLEYNTDLFQTSTIDRFIEHFQTLLEGIVANPNQRLSDLPLLSSTERHQLLVEWNQTQTDYPHDQCIHQQFEAQVAQTPDAIAIVFAEQQLTYRELNQRANQVAHYLQKLGVKPEVPVGICVDRSPEMIIGLLGILKAGGAYVPLDPSYPQARLAFMLSDTQVPVVLTRSPLLEQLPEIQATFLCLDTDWEIIAQETNQNPVSSATPDNLAYLMYTSGSTGQPKGVSIVHRGAVRLVQNNHYANLTAEEVFLQLAPIAFDASTFEIWGSLLNGARLVLMPPGVPSLRELGQAIRQHQITTLWLTAGLFHQMVDEQLEDLKPLRQLLAGGDVLSVSHVQKLLQASPELRLINGYGPTENTTFTCCYSIVDPDPMGATVAIGRPISNTQVYLLDDQLQPVPIGIPGELYIGGDGLARGYFNRPELTAERFISNPFQGEHDSPTLYRTGDLARYRSDGNIEFLGRLDDQVKLRGFRIELGEIEAVLSHHPAVQTTVVVVRKDEHGKQNLVAYVVPHQSFAPATADLRSFLQTKLPEYIIPSHFVCLEALPLTPNGKVDRRALPAPDTLERQTAFVAPRTAVEQQLAEIWANVLGLQHVGIQNNFFELGGHSLLATQLIARIRDVLQVELPLRCLFQTPTIASLANTIAQTKLLEPQPLNNLPTIAPDISQRYQPFPLNEMQQAYWLGRTSIFEMGNVAIHGYVEIESDELDLERFNLAWQRLVERHDMLRAIVLPDGHQQILQQVPTYQIPVLDLRGQETGQVESQLQAIREELSHQVLPLDRFPLFDLRASRLSDRRIRLHISMDAICLDGWSYQILFRDLMQLYRNPDAALMPLELSFRDYVLAVLDLQNTPIYQQSLQYWRDRLATLPPAPELPLAKAPSSLTQPRFKRWSATLAPELWQRLKARSRRAGLSPTGVLLAVYAEVLTTWSKSPRFTLNVPRFNRLPLHPQVNDLIGEFASFTLLEVDHTHPASFEVRAQRLQAQLWQDLEHPYVSGVRVLRELAQAHGKTTGIPMPIVFTTYPQNTPGETNSSIATLIQELGDIVYILGQTPQVWIDSQFSEAEGALCLNWDAVEELFPVGMLDDMFAAYCRLLQRLATEETTWQETNQQLLPPAQQAQQSAFRANQAPVPDKLLQTLFAEQVAQRPQQVAVITSDCTLTYEELFQRSNQVGHRLRQLGVRPNQLVAIVMDKGWEQILAVMGILNAGSAYLPIDPELPQERLHYVLENAEAEIVLTQSWLRERLQLPPTIQSICIDTNELINEPVIPLEPVQQLDDLAYVIYTSGSTGLPKGVMIAHRGVVNAIAQTNQHFQICNRDRVLALTALYHDMSVYDIFGTLAAGGTLVIPDAALRRDPAHWSELMMREQVTLWNSVPAMMEMLLEYAAERPEVLPASLRWAFLGGDWISVTLPDRLKALVPEAQVVSVGGPTETTLWNIWYAVEVVDPNWKSIPYGKPIANTQYYILNKALEDCPVWIPGEMYCAGVGLAQGYWRNLDKTQESFIQHPVTGVRLYRTGDLGRYLPDGNIEFLGRDDFRLKIRGQRIEAGEIEAVLNQHPMVRSSVVMAVGEQPNRQSLAAYVITAPEATPTVEELRQFLSQKLPEYMVPSAFVMLDALPLTPNGKVDRRSLAALLLSNLDVIASQRNFVAPQTALEKVLAGIWADVLQLEQVGVHDNFFLDLGGNSLLATQVVSAVRDTLQVNLGLRCLFDSPTIAEQAADLLKDSVQAKQVEQTAQLLLTISELSDHEVETLLEEKRSYLQVGV
ncbi:MAG: amino acid adenylation domain-containing protein [Myxacorys californica WJT36-NPBG1]|jgi:amino acid adenylation domain-containing protein|nr:amino acid adenylation domain-containing protein [Myxacorys californica WJT36-NPBG1]